MAMEIREYLFLNYVRLRANLKYVDERITPNVIIESEDLLIVGVLPINPLKPDEYSVIVTPKMSPDMSSRKELSFTITVDCADLPLKIYSIPYLHKLGDDLELTKATENIEVFDFKSKDQLDKFLSTYPDSARAPIIFAIRMNLLREGAKNAETEAEIISVINDYNAFIQKYPDTTGAQIATHEVFQIYKRHDSIATYTEFLQRYPFSLEAYLAEEHIKRKLFDSVMAQDDITAYDEFIEMFPEAEPYISKMIARAEDLKKAEVKKMIESLKQEEPLTLRYKRENYASDLYNEWADLTKQPVSESNALLIKTRLKRIESVLSSELDMTPSYQTLEVTKSIDKTKSLLVNLDDLIQKNHRETLTTINEGFQNLHEYIDQPFDALNLTLNHIEERLKRQEDATDALNKRLDDLNALIDAHYTALKQQSGDLKEALASMKQSGLLDTTLSAVSGGVDVYNAFKSPYVQEEDKLFNPNFSPDAVINNNKNKKSPYFKISSWIGAACPTLSGALVATTSFTDPIAAGVGMLTNATCKWGVSWLSKKFTR